jgi:SAM-dependent methyltransferase
MTTSTYSNPAFAGSIPENYHTFLGPVLFETYAADMRDRLAAEKLPANAHLLELACGTGIVTRQVLAAMPRDSRLTATDVSEPMLAFARPRLPEDPRLTLSRADACELPFADRSFDAAFCQYGVMFFADKVKAMREARRVLKPGGVYVFNVWDSLERNPIAGAVQQELDTLFPKSPPSFLRTPFGWHDRAEVERTTRAGGFEEVRVTEVSVPCTAPDAQTAARAFLMGTPLAVDLADRGTDMPAMLTHMTGVLASRFGAAPCRSTMNALVVEAR